MIMYNGGMYEWDEAKRVSNLLKHHIDFADIDKLDWDTSVIERNVRNSELDPGSIS